MFFLKKGHLTYIIVGVLSKPNLVMRKIIFFIKQLLIINNIDKEKIDKADKSRIRNFIDFYISYLEERNFQYIYKDLAYLMETHKQVFSKISQTDSSWKSRIVRRKKSKKKEYNGWEITCPICGARGKEYFKKVDDKSKIVYYISIVPRFAKNYICK